MIKNSNTACYVSNTVTPISVPTDGKILYFSNLQKAIEHFKNNSKPIEMTLFGNTDANTAITLPEHIILIVTPNVSSHGAVTAADSKHVVKTQTDANGNTIYQVIPRPIEDYAASILDDSGTLLCFDTLQDAVNAVQNGQTIVLHHANAENIVVSRAITFKIGQGTISGNTYKITAGSGFILSQNGNEYTITANVPSTGGGGSSSLYTITVDKSPYGTISIPTHYAHKNQSVSVTIKPNDGYMLKRLSITDKKGKTIPVTSINNRYTFTMPGCNVTISAEFKPEEYPFPFIDVTDDNWFFDAVSYVYTEGMMNGTSHTTFSPRQATTRGMIVTILWRAENCPQVNIDTAFSDVTKGKYYHAAVSWANANGIVKGCGNGLFGPNDRITREQMAAILYRYAQYNNLDVSPCADLSRYSDAEQISPYAENALSWAIAEKLMIGTSTSNICPKGYASRAEAASILMRFCNHFPV